MRFDHFFGRNLNRTIRIVIGVFLFSILTVSCNAQTSDARLQGPVSRIVDGDTFYIKGVERRIRLWGIDAPERDEIGYAEAKRYLESLIGEKTVSCRQIDTDRNNRTVARCFLKDGEEVNRSMLDEPYTNEYCYFSKGFYGRC